MRARHAAAALAQRFLEVHTRQPPRGPQPEEKRGDGRKGNGEGQDRAVEPDLVDARQIGRRKPQDGSNARVGGQHTGRSGQRREGTRLHEELPHQIAAAGPDGRPHNDLAAARLGPCEKQPGDVHARDEQHESDRAEQDVERRLDVAGDVILERIHEDPVSGIVGRILLLELLADDVHLGLDLDRRDAWLQARDHLQPVTGTAVGAASDDQGRPEFAVLRRKRKAGRHDADDRQPPAVEVERLADHAGAVSLSNAAKPSLRQTPADEDHVLLARNLLVLCEETPFNRCDAEHVEERGFGVDALDPLRLAVADEVQRRLGECRHRFE